jgi:lipid-A-disaccharide synthase
MIEILLVSGEASGDIHGANLIKQLKRTAHDLKFTAVGSNKMRSEGAHILFDIKNLSVMGIIEVVKKIPTIFWLFRRIKLYIRQNKPHLVVLIDAPDFNLRLAKKIRSEGVKIIYYISPTLWAWRYGRIGTIKKYVDKMLVILPFEEEIYRRENVPVMYVGHPLLDELKGFLPEAPKELPRDKTSYTIAILAGSRQYEISFLINPILEACALIKEKIPNVNFVISKADTISEDFLKNQVGNFPLSITSDPVKEFIGHCDAAIVKSGTSTLEVGLFCVPMVIIYKFSWLTYFIAKYIVRVKKQQFGLVNILAKQNIVKELFQHEVTGINIAHEILQFLTDKSYYDTTSQKLFHLRAILKNKEASENAANEIRGFIQAGPSPQQR